MVDCDSANDRRMKRFNLPQIGTRFLSIPAAVYDPLNVQRRGNPQQTLPRVSSHRLC